MTTTKLSDLIPPRTAGSLPSSRTEGLLAQALESDDIDEVKAQLVHIWGHYQSLEFFLNDRAGIAETIRNAQAADLEQDVDPVDLVIGFLSTGGTDMAYDLAHNALNGVAAGYTVPEALRVIYSHLDHTDPERELSERDLEAFFAALDDDLDKD